MMGRNTTRTRARRCWRWMALDVLRDLAVRRFGEKEPAVGCCTLFVSAGEIVLTDELGNVAWEGAEEVARELEYGTPTAHGTGETAQNKEIASHGTNSQYWAGRHGAAATYRAGAGGARGRGA